MTLPADTGVFTIIFIALGLSADCFAVAIGAGLSGTGQDRWRPWRTSLSFGLFQALMPVLGWLAGRTAAGIVSDFDHWVAFALLAGAGLHMLWESFRPAARRQQDSTDITRGFRLLAVSVATSIDALAVGLSFAFLEANILLASTVIGFVALVVTAVGFVLGSKVGKLAGKRAETIGGLILIGIGIRILLSHIA